jgi:hypothetical protein
LLGEQAWRKKSGGGREIDGTPSHLLWLLYRIRVRMIRVSVGEESDAVIWKKRRELEKRRGRKERGKCSSLVFSSYATHIHTAHSQSHTHTQIYKFISYTQTYIASTF